MNRTHGILDRVGGLGASRRARHLAALLAFAVLGPACPSGGGGGIFIPLSVQFQQATFTVAENGATATITLTRAGTASGAVSVNFATSNGTAAQPGDYTTNSGTILWADGDAADKTFTVTINNDGTVEGDETVNLTLSLPTGGAILGTQSTALLTITDDDAPPAGVVQFSSPTYTVNEDGVSATILVTRTGGSAGPASVTFADAGTGSATGTGTDYTLAGGVLNWAAGDATPKPITVTIVNDALLEPNETVNLSLSAPVGAALGTTTAAVLTILDNDSPASLQFSSATYDVSESGVTATITVTRTGGVGNAVGATFATSDGTATVAGPDYVAATGTVSWAAGDSAAKTFTVSISADTLVEGDHTVNLTLSAPTGGAVLGAQSTAVLTILDDDCTLQFTAATFSVVENAGTASITVSRIGSTVGAVSVDFSNPVGGTATSGGTDYTFAAGTLTWAIGDSASKTISIPVANDTSPEGDETTNLALTNVTGVGALAGTQTTAVVTLVDNDVEFQFSAAAYGVGEAGPTATITVNRVGSSSGAASVVWADAGTGTATGGGADYTAAGGTLNWADGVTTPQTFTIAIVSDNGAEGNETVNLALSSPATLQAGGNAALGTPNTAVLTITDDDVNLQLTSATYSGAENGGAITVTVTRTGLTTGPCSVNWSLVNGTTVAGDYTAAPGTLNWAAGDGANKTFTITPVNDAAVEGSETLTINLATPVGATLGTPNSAVLTILDDDVPSASIDDVSVAEGAAGTVNLTFTITLSTAAVVPGSVTVNTANGTATSGSDYTALVSQVVNFAALDTQQQVTVVVNGDTTDEVSETFFVNLSAPVNLNITDNQGVGTITNDDDPDVTIADVALPEGAGGTTTFTFTVTLSHASLQDVTFNYSTANGTATIANGDYVAIGTTPKTIPAGQLSTTIDVTVNGDSTDEANETFLLDLFTFTNVGFVDPQATGTIQNDDDPSISINDVTQTEGTGGTTNVTFTVTLSNASAEVVSVNFATADGIVNGATAPADYTAQSNTLNIPIGNLTGQIVIAVNPDALDEVNEHFFVNLSTPVNAAISDSQGQGNITDDDGPNITINDVTLPEGNGGSTTFQFTVTLSTTSLQDVSVTYTAANGTATAPGDYTGVTATATITAGNLTTTIDIAVVGDTTGELDETFNVNLSAPANGTITDNQGAGTIQNDDNPGISISDPVFVEGNSGTFGYQFSVTLTNPPLANVTVNYTTQDGTATQPGDYATNANTLSWLAGDFTSRTIVVDVVGDTTGEPDETFTVLLSGATNATIVKSTGTGTILNDDGPDITITQSTVIVEGTGGPGSTIYPFTVTLSMNPPSPVTVNFTTTDGTATAADGDFTTNTGLLTFNPGGPLVQSINVTIGRDSKHEPNETFTVDLTGATGGTITVPSATGTINDDDPQPSISISDVTLVEGNAGTTAFSFNVTLSNATFEIVTVTANTADGSATLADSDYQQVLNQTVTFNPFVTMQTVTVLVNGDTTLESNETFTVALSSPGNASILDGTGSGTIQNDEGPMVSAANPPDTVNPVNTDVNLVITFNMPMVKSSVESLFSLSPLAGAPVHSFFWDTPGLNGTVMTVVFDTIAPFGTITGNDVLADNTTFTWTITAGAQSATPGPTMPVQTGQFRTVLDTTPPTITSIRSNPAVENQDPRTTILTGSVTLLRVVFNEPMNTTNGSATAELESANDQRSASVGNPDNTPLHEMSVTWFNPTTLDISFSPTALSANTAYRLDLWGLNDANGNWPNSMGRFTLLTAGSKTNPPTITANWPPNGAVGVSRDTQIFIATTEPLSPNVSTLLTISPPGTPFQIRAEAGDGPQGINISPRKGWPANTLITVSIPAGVTNASGIALAPFSTSFTTGATGVGTNPIVIDVPFSTLKNAMTDCSIFGGAQGELYFKDSVTNARVYLDETTLLPATFSITDSNGIPVKKFTINPFGDDDPGRSLEIGRTGGPGTTNLQQGMTYTLTLKGSIAGSTGQTFTQTQYTFTTIPNSNTLERPSPFLNDSEASTLEGPPTPSRTVRFRVGMGGNFGTNITAVAVAGSDTAYTLSTAPPGWVAPGAIVRVQGCPTAANNGDFTVVSVSGGPPPIILTLANASGVTEVAGGNASIGVPHTASVADVTGAGNTFSANLTQNSFDYEYETPPGPPENESTIVTSGIHTFRYTLGDGVPAHSIQVDEQMFFYTGADMTAQTLNAPTAGLTPTYSWTGAAPATATAIFVFVVDGAGTEYFWVVPPTQTSFTQPANYPLAAGSCAYTIGYFHSSDNTLRGEGGEGIKNPFGFTR